MQLRPRGCASVTLALVAAVTGCGGHTPPRLAGADAAPLVALSHRIAGEGACAQARDIRKLKRAAAALVDAQRVPHPLEPAFVAGVHALTDRTPPCIPVIPAVSATPPAAPPPHGRGHGHDKHGHGHGDGGGD